MFQGPRDGYEGDMARIIYVTSGNVQSFSKIVAVVNLQDYF